MTASFLEIVQVIAALVGFLLTIKAKVSADLSLVTLRRKGLNGNRLLIAEKNVRNEDGHMHMQMILFLVGLTSLFLAPPPFARLLSPDPEAVRLMREANLQLGITRVGMTAISLYLMYLSYRGWLEERIPILLQYRKNDGHNVTGTSVAQKAQVAASAAQELAAMAQDAATVAQETASVSQDAATEAISMERKQIDVQEKA